MIISKRVWLLTICVLAALLSYSQAALASFGIASGDVSFTGPTGEPEMQAGSHPYDFTTKFTLNTKPAAKGEVVPDGEAKDITINFPPGLVGTPTPVPRCASTDFALVDFEHYASHCSPATQVGIAEVAAGFGSVPSAEAAFEEEVPVFNLVPPPGVASKLGFVVKGASVTFETVVNPNPPYNLITHVTNIPNFVQFYGSRVVLWGVPSDPSHDPQRYCPEHVGGCHAALPEVPFLTLPRSCSGPLTSAFEADSWQNPGVWTEPLVTSTQDQATPANSIGISGCERLGFSPTVDAQPTTGGASSPTGLKFRLEFKAEGLTASKGLAQSDVKKAVVALPEAMSVNPALAEGLVGCSEAQYASETVGSDPGTGCPSESKIGTVEVETPLLEHALHGALYIARQAENPFGSLLALYVVIKDPETGIMLKLPGRVVPNETTGQLVSEFDNLPQLPFSVFRLNFREGQRSPLVTPAACGTYVTDAELTPWASPSSVLHDDASFTVTSGIDGAPCPAGGVPPFEPSLIAGTQNNAAGAYSPVDIELIRKDGEQEITGFSSLLPAGLTANLTGVPFCSEAEIATARGKSGRLEEVEPSCPPASQIGHTLVGVGVGSVLAYTPGKLYMAGPFEGAPFSVVAITSAKVGPFDLGTVVVHLPLDIDPVTAQVSIPVGPADQIPHIIKGIVVHVRDIRVYVDRPNFTLNPTNCSALRLSSVVIGSGADVASAADDVPVRVSDPFQAADCANLTFKPSFRASTSAKTSRKDGASLHVTLAYPKAQQGTQANVHEVHVELPIAMPSELRTLQKACTEAQFNANPAGCPAESVVGHAKALTPILPVPLEGPAYFVSRGAQWPELIMVLQGYGITIDLHGETFISKKGVTSSTFSTVPDQPVDSFELTLPEGPHSALAANGNLCKKKLVMPTLMIGQNGAKLQQKTRIQVYGCPDKLLVGAPKPKDHKLKLRVSVPAAGKLTASGKGLSKASRKASGRETLTLTLRQRKQAYGTARKVTLSFTPSSGTHRKKLKRTITVKPAGQSHKRKPKR